MDNFAFRVGSLVLYKQEPARVTGISEKKIAIEWNGRTVSVRPKDVVLLHPGPLNTLPPPVPQNGDIHTAWELLAGEVTTIEELAELAFGGFTPGAAWALWQQVADGVYFSGEPSAVQVHSAEQVAAIQAERAAREAEAAAWDAFLARVSAGQLAADDGRFLQDVVNLALGQQSQSKVLKALRQKETPEQAHALLLACGYWDETVNPYPARSGLPASDPQIDLPPLPDEPRRDLTHLTALAIDDAGSEDPDDAVSWENGRLWVHIADVAALIPPDSPADVEARARGANLYLPEGTVHMLPPQATHLLALGLADVSPALSFGMDVDAQGQVTNLEIVPSWVKVTRLSYDEAETRLAEEPFASLLALAEKAKARRLAAGAVEIDLPEVRVRLNEAGEVEIRPLPPLQARTLVREAMLMAGEAVGRYALQHNIPIPFTVQDPPFTEPAEAHTLSENFALRRSMQPSQQSSQPGAHAGLGLGIYVQATSPLRRYLDMVTHQQLRAFLRGDPLLDSQDVMARVGAADAVSGDVRWAERQSVKHWTLVHLQRHPAWQGEGVVVDSRGKRALVLIPALAWDSWVHLPQPPVLDQVVVVGNPQVDLPNLDVAFTPELTAG